MQRCLRLFLTTASLFLFPALLQAGSRDIVNVYTWAEEIPPDVIAQFERETGIHVNHAAFDSNEVMFAKLRTNHAGFDLIEPSSYYIQRMRRLGLLEPLDFSRLPEAKHLNPWFAKQGYDPGNRHSVPFIWGITGIFINKNDVPAGSVTRWSDLRGSHFHNQLMILDDPRETFSMGLRMLGYSINDTDPAHLRETWLLLRKLMPNIRLFNSDAVKSILIDEDAPAGMVWSGDFTRAQAENSQLEFILPADGFEVWVDNFAILKDAPHKDNAYRLLNFLLRPDISKRVSMRIGYATANLTAQKSLPEAIRNNHALYPTPEMMKGAEVQTDVGNDTFALYEKYWEKLKTGI